MVYQELRRRLRHLGFEVYRQGGRHETWTSSDRSKKTQIPRHRGEVPPGTLAQILKALDLTLEDLQGRGRHANA